MGVMFDKAECCWSHGVSCDSEKFGNRNNENNETSSSVNPLREVIDEWTHSCSKIQYALHTIANIFWKLLSEFQINIHPPLIFHPSRLRWISFSVTVAFYNNRERFEKLLERHSTEPLSKKRSSKKNHLKLLKKWKFPNSCQVDPNVVDHMGGTRDYESIYSRCGNSGKHWVFWVHEKGNKNILTVQVPYMIFF